MESTDNFTFTDDKIDVPVSREVLQEIMYRAVPEADADVIESVDDILQYFRFKREENANEYGDAGKGYRRGDVYIPNGSQLYVVHKNKVHHAAVKFEKIVYEGESFSPSGLVKKIAGGSRRDAWRHIFIQRPDDDVWQRADEIQLKNAIRSMIRRSQESIQSKRSESSQSV